MYSPHFLAIMFQQCLDRRCFADMLTGVTDDACLFHEAHCKCMGKVHSCLIQLCLQRRATCGSAGYRLVRFSLPEPCCRGMSIADVLHPLPLSSLGAFLVSFSASRGDAAMIYQDMQGAGLLGPNVRPGDLEQVVYKLQLAHPEWLRATPLLTTTVLKRCPQCGCDLVCKLVSCHVLTFAKGLQPLQVQRESCLTCNVAYCGSWTWNVGSSGRATLHRPIAPADLVLLTLWPEASSIAAMDKDMFAFLTASLLHVRSSFRGFASLMEDFHAIPHREHLHDQLLYSWLVHKAVLELQGKHWEMLQQVSFCFQRHRSDLRCETLGALYLPLQQAFLQDFAECHRCVACVRHPVLAFDGKVNHAVPICQRKTGRTLHLLRGDVLLDYGCVAPRLRGSYACAEHHTDAAISKTNLQCCRGHTLRRRRSRCDIECSQCGEVIAANGALWKCDLGCLWNLCHSCALAQVPAIVADMPVPAAASDGATEDMQLGLRDVQGALHTTASMSEESLLLEAGNPCGLVKGQMDACSFRFYGGVITALLGCGRVAMILPIAGHESLTQIFGMLAAVRTRRDLDFVMYDNACALARFTRKIAARSASAAPQLCAQLTFVLDRWHKQNHRACLSPAHPMFMPEVDVDLHPQLKDFNSSMCEQFNAWFELFVPLTRNMHAETFDIFTLLLARLWNERVVASRPAAAGPAPNPSARSLLKRRRA